MPYQQPFVAIPRLILELQDEEHHMRETILATAILIVILAHSTIPGNCYAMSATIDKEKIHVKINSVLLHNFTELRTQDLSFSGDDISRAANAIESAVKAKQGNAAVSNLILFASLSSSSIRVDTEFDIRGPILVEGAILKANSSWRSFEVPENMSSRGVFWNRVGELYFAPRVDYFANMTDIRFILNQTSAATPREAKTILKELRMLDFRALSLGLSKWNLTRSLTDGKTRLTAKLGKIFDFSARKTSESPYVQYVVSKTLDAEISIPGYAVLQGETIWTDVGTGGTELVMLGFVLLTVVGAISTRWLKRRRERT